VDGVTDSVVGQNGPESPDIGVGDGDDNDNDDDEKISSR
jgi:hypothetical protein